MAQRVRKPHRGKIPSSSGQLPVPMALNARLSTLFAHTIHQMSKKVKGKWKKLEKKLELVIMLRRRNQTFPSWGRYNGALQIESAENSVAWFFLRLGMIRAISQTSMDRMECKHLREEWQCNARN